MQDKPIGLTAFLIRPDQIGAFEKKYSPAHPASIALAAPLHSYFHTPAVSRPHATVGGRLLLYDRFGCEIAIGGCTFVL